MGLLVNGEWRDQWYDTEASQGKFVRTVAKFRHWITADGSAGPSGEGGFTPDSGRYHLYVSHACPWAHRALIFRELKGLAPHISVSAVHPRMLSEGWTFEEDEYGATGDQLFGSRYLREVYLRADPEMTGRVTVPVLWDTHKQTIVSNESSEIIRMFNSAFDELTGNEEDFWPLDLREALEPVNARIYDTVNNGVYKSGFATSQEAYEESVYPLFESLEWLEGLLAERRYLMGSRVTEADWRLFTTLIRFDPVYHLHFKCNRKRIVDYPNLWAYTRELYQWSGVAETVNIHHIVDHYHYSHPTINPSRIIPINPVLDYDEPHGRDALLSI